MGLVERLLAAKPAHESILPEADIAFCKKHQALLDETLSQLRSWEHILKDYCDKENNPAYSFEKTYHRHKDDVLQVKENYRHSYQMAEAPNLYDKYKFTPYYGYIKVRELIDDAITYFTKTIIGYFEKTYNLDLPDIEVDDQYRATYSSYETIIDGIRKHTGGLDLRSIGVEKAYEEFREKIYSADRVKLSGKTIEIKDYMYYDRPYSNDGLPKFKHKSEATDLVPLEKALSIFEREEVIDGFCFNSVSFYSNTVDFTKDYFLINNTRLEGIRFFKNQKIILKFTDTTAASDFYNRFQLANIK